MKRYLLTGRAHDETLLEVEIWGVNALSALDKYRGENFTNETTLACAHWITVRQLDE